MKSIPTAAAQLVPLPTLPVPPMLEEALGYSGVGRYVAFWWEPVKNTLCHSDGLRTTRAGQYYGWLLYCQHPRIAPHLFPFSFGSGGEAVAYAFLLDRWERQAYVGQRRQVLDLLDRVALQQLPDIAGAAAMPQALASAENAIRQERRFEQCNALADWLNQPDRIAKKALC